jgi:RNA polymerase sigma-70 factor (sigma-E family)
MSMGTQFDEFVASRWTRLARSAVLMGADPHAAEDFVQTALAKCYVSWDKVVRAEDPDAYVHRVLINVMRDSRRRRWWGERAAAELPEVLLGDRTEGLADQDAMRRALGCLPLPQRQVLILRFYVDLSEAQTARVLGVSPGTVKSRAARALRALEAHPGLEVLTSGVEG